MPKTPHAGYPTPLWPPDTCVRDSMRCIADSRRLLADTAWLVRDYAAANDDPPVPLIPKRER